MKKQKPPQGFSINQLSTMLKVDRRTVTNAARGVEPAGERNKNPVYALKDIESRIAAKPDKSLKEEKLAEEIRKLRITNDRAEKVLILRAQVTASLNRCLGTLTSLLEQKICNELPAAIVGLQDVNQGRIIAQRGVDEVLKPVRELEGEWPA